EAAVGLEKEAALALPGIETPREVAPERLLEARVDQARDGVHGLLVKKGVGSGWGPARGQGEHCRVGLYGLVVGSIPSVVQVHLEETAAESGFEGFVRDLYRRERPLQERRRRVEGEDPDWAKHRVVGLPNIRLHVCRSGDAMADRVALSRHRPPSLIDRSR